MRTMLNKIQVYALADKYDIQPLKQLAWRKSMDQIHDLIAFGELDEPICGLEVILEKVVSTTPDSDMGLRNLFTEMCVPLAKQALENEHMNILLKERGDCGLSFLGWMERTMGWNSADAHARELGLKDENQALRAQLSATKAQIGTLLDEKLVWYHPSTGMGTRVDLDSPRRDTGVIRRRLQQVFGDMNIED